VNKQNPHSVFKASDRQRRDLTFVVTHFAGEVEYTADGFVEKNKDSLLADVGNLWDSDCMGFFKDVMLDDPVAAAAAAAASSSPSASGKRSASTISSKFKKSLTSLLHKISLTGPHYVRCLKPNDEAKPNLLIRSRLTEQLRYGGVLEAVRVCREGYAVKFTHEEFFGSYSPLFQLADSTSALLSLLVGSGGGGGGEGGAAAKLTFGPSTEKVRRIASFYLVRACLLLQISSNLFSFSLPSPSFFSTLSFSPLSFLFLFSLFFLLPFSLSLPPHFSLALFFPPFRLLRVCLPTSSLPLCPSPSSRSSSARRRSS